jgi:hypothetical protein
MVPGAGTVRTLAPLLGPGRHLPSRAPGTGQQVQRVEGSAGAPAGAPLAPSGPIAVPSRQGATAFVDAGAVAVAAGIGNRQPDGSVTFNAPLEGIGVQALGVPSTGLPSTGLPSTGLPSTGLRSTGLPSAGLQASGLQGPGLPSTGPHGTPLQRLPATTAGPAPSPALSLATSSPPGPAPTYHLERSGMPLAPVASTSPAGTEQDELRTPAAAQAGTAVAGAHSVQTAGPAPAGEGPAPSPPAVAPEAAPAPAAAGQDGPDLDELAKKLYDRIRWRLRAELRLDAERSGRATGLQR